MTEPFPENSADSTAEALDVQASPERPATPAGAPTATPAQPPLAAAPEWGRVPENDEDGWEKLSAKNLLLGPVEALKAMIIPFGAVLIGTSSLGSLWMALAAAGVAVLGAAIGLIPWWTNRFRITDRQLQYRHGVVSSNINTAPLERIRSVDLEAKLLHRLLGLRTVQIGTGVDDDRISLNGLDAARAEELRSYLLDRRRTTASAPAVAPAAGDTSSSVDVDPMLVASPAPEVPAAPERLLATIDWTWLRFAPFDLTRLAVIAAAFGVIAQVAGDGLLPESWWRDLDDRGRALADLGLTLVAIGAIVIALLAWIIVAVIGFVLQWWGLRLTSSRGSLHMTHGLLSTRSVSVEEKRVRGVEMDEPLLLRPARGANLHTLATGMGSDGLTRILPQAPVTVVRRVGSDVLGADDALTMALVRHSAAARRRSHLRQARPTLYLALLGGAVHLGLERFTDWDLALWALLVPAAVWLLMAPVRAELAFAHLGHALTGTHLVVGSGTTTRTRTALEIDGIIGWAVERSWFQRRVGLCTLVATTAAGNEQVTLLDVEESVALALMASATPESVLPFAA